MDFSENYRCHYRDEVQSGYFDQIPVTIHPMMCYYLKDNALVKHAIIGVSDDTRHDWCMVKQFEEQATEIVGRQILISKIYQWTDGCAAQYKGKHSFCDISLRNVEVFSKRRMGKAFATDWVRLLKMRARARFGPGRR